MGVFANALNPLDNYTTGIENAMATHIRSCYYLQYDRLAIS